MENQKTLSPLSVNAKNRATEIARKTKSCPESHYTSFYEGENSNVVGYIQNGFNTRRPQIDFGSSPLRKKDVLRIINELN